MKKDHFIVLGQDGKSYFIVDSRCFPASNQAIEGAMVQTSNCSSPASSVGKLYPPVLPTNYTRNRPDYIAPSLSSILIKYNRRNRH